MVQAPRISAPRGLSPAARKQVGSLWGELARSFWASVGKLRVLKAAMAGAHAGQSGGVTVLRRNTPLDSNPACVSVCSYNLLAPIYVRPVDYRTGKVQAFAEYAWCADEHLQWDRRRAMIVEELSACRADVIALQEVQFEEQKSPAGKDEFALPAYLRTYTF